MEEMDLASEQPHTEAPPPMPSECMQLTTPPSELQTSVPPDYSLAAAMPYESMQYSTPPQNFPHSDQENSPNSLCQPDPPENEPNPETPLDLNLQTHPPLDLQSLLRILQERKNLEERLYAEQCENAQLRGALEKQHSYLVQAREMLARGGHYMAVEPPRLVEDLGGGVEEAGRVAPPGEWEQYAESLRKEVSESLAAKDAEISRLKEQHRKDLFRQRMGFKRTLLQIIPDMARNLNRWHLGLVKKINDMIPTDSTGEERSPSTTPSKNGSQDIGTDQGGTPPSSDAPLEQEPFENRPPPEEDQPMSAQPITSEPLEICTPRETAPGRVSPQAGGFSPQQQDRGETGEQPETEGGSVKRSTRGGKNVRKRRKGELHGAGDVAAIAGMELRRAARTTDTPLTEHSEGPPVAKRPKRLSLLLQGQSVTAQPIISTNEEPNKITSEKKVPARPTRGANLRAKFVKGKAKQAPEKLLKRKTINLKAQKANSKGQKILKQGQAKGAKVVRRRLIEEGPSDGGDDTGLRASWGTELLLSPSFVPECDSERFNGSIGWAGRKEKGGGEPVADEEGEIGKGGAEGEGGEVRGGKGGGGRVEEGENLGREEERSALVTSQTEAQENVNPTADEGQGDREDRDKSIEAGTLNGVKHVHVANEAEQGEGTRVSQAPSHEEKAANPSEQTALREQNSPVFVAGQKPTGKECSENPTEKEDAPEAEVPILPAAGRLNTPSETEQLSEQARPCWEITQEDVQEGRPAGQESDREKEISAEDSALGLLPVAQETAREDQPVSQKTARVNKPKTQKSARGNGSSAQETPRESEPPALESFSAAQRRRVMCRKRGPQKEETYGTLAFEMDGQKVERCWVWCDCDSCKGDGESTRLPMTPPEFERHAGSARKNWRTSIIFLESGRTLREELGDVPLQRPSKRV